MKHAQFDYVNQFHCLAGDCPDTCCKDWQIILDEDALASSGVLTYGSNVKEVTTQVSEGAVDCGIIYATDAFSAGLDTVDEATADICGQVIYPAAVLKNSTHADEAKAFLDYLTTDEAGKVFESVGFTTLA